MNKSRSCCSQSQRDVYVLDLSPTPRMARRSLGPWASSRIHGPERDALARLLEGAGLGRVRDGTPETFEKANKETKPSMLDSSITTKTFQTRQEQHYRALEHCTILGRADDREQNGQQNLGVLAQWGTDGKTKRPPVRNPREATLRPG